MLLFSRMLYKRKFLIAATLLISGLNIILSLWWNKQISYIINMVSVGKSVSSNTVIVSIITILLCGAASYILGLISGLTCETLAHDLRMGYARYFTTLSMIESESLNAGEQLSRLQNEITDVSSYLQNNLFQIADSLIRFISTFIWFLFLNPALTLSANLPVVFILIYIVYSSRIISAAAEQSQQAKMKMNGYADTLLTLFPIIKLYDAVKFNISNYNSMLGKWQELTIKEERTKARLMSLSAILSCVPLLLLFLFGGKMVIDKQISLGTLYIFINLSGNVSGVMMNMPGFIPAFRRFSVNIKRISPYIIMERGR